MTLPLIEVLATGGTIAGQGNSATGSSYRAGELSGEALLASVPGLSGVARVRVRQVASIPSQDMTEDVWLALLRAITENASGASGFVITHGTDTMEETAFFLDLALPAGSPAVVATGAMLPSTALSADGPRNIFNAVCAAADPRTAGHGVLVAMDGELLRARGVFKSNTLALGTFRPRISGPEGWIQNGEAHFASAPAARHPLPFPAPGELLAQGALPKVALLATWAGVDGEALRAFARAGYAGAVIEGMGDGNIPRQMLADAMEAASRGFRVVRASRCPFGPVLEAGETDDRACGTVCAGSLSPAQARIVLQLALAASPGISRDGLQEIFRQF